MKPRKLLARITFRQTNVRFRDLVRLAEARGFVKDRQSSTSHQIFKHSRFPDARLNLQPVGGEAKPYQIKQLLSLVEEYNLTLDEPSNDA